MKLTTIYSLIAAAAAGLGLWSCSADNLGVSEPDNGPALGETVRLTVAVSRDPSAATRTEMTEANGGADLACKWTEGDKLLVTDASGVRRGVLEITGGVGEAEGTFTGEVSVEGLNEGENTLNFLYLGTDLNSDKTVGETTSAAVNATGEFRGWDDAAKTYTADYTIQKGTLESLTEKDFLTATKTGTLTFKGEDKGELYSDGIQMERRISFAKFKLNMPAGVTLGADAQVTVAGTGLNTLAEASFTDNKVDMAYYNPEPVSTKSDDDPDFVSGSASTTVTVVVPGKPKYSGKAVITHAKDGTFYMVLLPNGLKEEEAKFDLTFTLVDGGSTYKGTYTVTKEIVESKYYRKHTPATADASESYDPIEITMDDADLVGPVFTVNGKSFRFTRANLKYDIDKEEWSLFDNQYDFLCKSGWHDQRGTKIDKINNGKNNITIPAEAKVIDLFGFGATGLKDEAKSGATEIRARAPQYYLEYPNWEYAGAYSKITATSEGAKFPSDDKSQVLNQGYVGSYLQHGINGTVYDWGTAYGKGLEARFFTLSSSDWKEIAKNYYMIGATITDAVNPATGNKGIYGCMIFNVSNPSDARNFFLDENGNKRVNYLAPTFPSRPEFKSDSGQGNPVNNISSGFSYTTLKMTKTEFAELEKEGHFVFLPEAGHRATTSLTKTSGYYWTSTNGQAWDARFFRFYGGTSETKFFCMDKMSKWYGCAVRLVKEVEVPANN